MFFLGNFRHFTDQEEKNEENRRHGDFSMMVQADAIERAMELFRKKVIEFRSSGSFFNGKCSVFLSELIEFTKFPKDDAVMLNYKSYVGDPSLPFIACVVPNEQSDACSIHDWQGKVPDTEGRKDTLFLEFK